MSLFTDLLKTTLGGSSAPTENQTHSLVKNVLEMLDSAGGIQGLTTKFQQSGLGDVVSSWVGTGENRPISPDQVAEVLGADRIQALAEKSGIPAEKGASVLSQVLPTLVDKLTPEGQVPDQSTGLSTWSKALLGGLGVAAAATAATAAVAAFRKKDEAAGEAAPDFSDVQAGSSAVAQGAAGAATGATYTVVGGDTLSKIAKRHYGDANQWSRIFEANRDQLKDPDRIFPGQVLRIP
ncbi:MAG: hypothetical protein H6R26_3374 [Proteobacteria bacterium]|nr:hypothetical protein [Pseudomonadota bacterium]